MSPEFLLTSSPHLHLDTDKRAIKRWLERAPNLILGVCLTLLGLLYAVLYRRFRAYEIDNPWYLSFSRNFWVNHFSGDSFLNGVFPDGMGGTAVFGRGPALVQGAALNPFGWQPGPALLLSTLVVLAGLTLWYAFLRRSGLSAERSCSSVLALGMLEPFVNMADRFRYEPYAFLLMAGAFWLASMRRPWMALVVALLVLETEPAAGMVFLALGLFRLRSGYKGQTLVIGSGVAVACFVLVYGSLHPDIVGIFRGTDWHRGSAQKEAGGFLRAYFIDRRRHLVELGLLAGCAMVLVRRYRETPVFVRRMTEIVLLLSACSFAMRWPTPAYMVFCYPALLVVAGWCLAAKGWSPWILPGVVMFIMLPQYGALVWINRHEGYRAEDLERVRVAIRESEQIAGLDDPRVKIMGDYSLWFAHPAGYQALGRTTLGEIREKNLFLCFDGPLRPSAMVDPIARYCGDLYRQTTAVEVNHLIVRGHLLRILARKANE
jgi:hypothetical protein